MGVLRTTAAVAHPARPVETRELIDVMVDTGSEYNWLPRALLEELGVEPVRVDRFQTADGRILAREMGMIVLYAGGRSTATMAAFAESGDMVLLGAHGLEGLNLRVDLVTKALVPAGPVPAAQVLRSPGNARRLAEALLQAYPGHARTIDPSH